MANGAAEAAIISSASPVDRARRERRFYSRMALFVAAIVFAGFAPSFYLKPLDIVHFPRPNPALNIHLLVHGTLFSLWVLLFIAQTQLVAAGRRDLHRTLGGFGFLLGLLLIPVMYVTVLDEIARNSTPPFVDVLTWTAVPLVPIPFYLAVLILGARTARRDLQAHKRFMLGLMLMLTQPATARLPFAPPTLGGFCALSLLTLFAFLPLFLWDRRTLGRFHPATVLTATLYVVVMTTQTLFLAVPGLWQGLVVHLPGVPG